MRLKLPKPVSDNEDLKNYMKLIKRKWLPAVSLD